VIYQQAHIAIGIGLVVNVHKMAFNCSSRLARFDDYGWVLVCLLDSRLKTHVHAVQHKKAADVFDAAL